MTDPLQVRLAVEPVHKDATSRRGVRDSVRDLRVQQRAASLARNARSDGDGSWVTALAPVPAPPPSRSATISVWGQPAQADLARARVGVNRSAP